MKQGRVVLILILSVILSGCLGEVWTGATMVYDRHNVYKQMHDYHLMIEVTNALFTDKKFKTEGCGDGCSIDLAIFNGDVLLAGHVPSEDYLNEVNRRLSPIHDYKHLFNEIKVDTHPPSNSQDSWITTKIRSRMFADSSIDPKPFKIVTVDGIVYLMGDVKYDQAEKVVNIARQTDGVVRVVKLMRYFTYEKHSVA